MLLLQVIASIYCILVCTANIIEENGLKGSKNWWYSQPNSTDFPLEGFADGISFVAGNVVTFKVKSVSTVKQYALRIYRLGYYGGSGARMIESIDKIEAKSQPDCTFTSSSRLTDCSNWHVSTSWTIPISSTSGVYIARPVLTQSNKAVYGPYIPFVVKQPLTLTSQNQYKIKGSDILFKISDLTWLAYNLYGGYNVYKSTTDRSFSARASQASFNRPFQNRHAYPLGQHQNFLFGSEYAMIFWLEQHGYDVSYIACEDLELLHDAKVLVPSNYRAILSVGHDEYWTQKMKDAFISARNAGVSLAFFSGNEGFWRVLWSDPAPFDRNDPKALVEYYNCRNKQSAVAYHRTITCRKETIDNIAATPTANEWTGTFVDPRHRPADPENSLTGQLFLVNSFRHEPIELRKEHMVLWFWRNTSFANNHASRWVGNGTHGGSTLLSNGIRVRHSSEYKRTSPMSKPTPIKSGRSLLSNSQDSSEVISARNLKASGSTFLSSSKSVYVSPAGYLGYEMDIFVDDCYRPAGLIALSHTERNITEALSEQYGASYKGSGVVTHKLALYRHIVSTTTAATLSDSAIANTTKMMTKVCRSDRKVAPSLSSSKVSALVFGAGTIQWSWALSDWHDGLTTPTDPVVQQATLNLLADMKVLPGAFKPDKASVTTFPMTSKDSFPPFSVITSNKLSRLPNTLRRNSLVHIKGVAYDKGGGRVAAVEVSVNGGKNWHLAIGRDRWKFSFKVEDDWKDELYGWHNCSAMNTNYMAQTREEVSGGAVINRYRDELIQNNQLYDPYSAHRYSFKNSSYTSMKLLILSRAVDDRGWMEEVAYNGIYCSLFNNYTSTASESRNALLMNVMLEE